MLLVVGLGALATHLGFEAILGAFIAGAILRLVDADAEHKHPLFHPKLDAIGYGFLIPVFFVTSGLTFNLSVLFSSASTLLRVPLFLLALLVVRGLPAVLYRSALPSIRDVAAVGLLQATSLPFIVAATTIGLQVHAIGRPTRLHSSRQGCSASSFFPASRCNCCDRPLKTRACSRSRHTFANSLKSRDQRTTARSRGVRHTRRDADHRAPGSCLTPGSPRHRTPGRPAAGWLRPRRSARMRSPGRAPGAAAVTWALTSGRHNSESQAMRSATGSQCGVRRSIRGEEWK
jgi:Kef-type K+ transport system membrane component KefB